MDKVKSVYQEAFKSHGDSASAVCWPKGRQDLRFAKLMANFPDKQGTILDFGSGLSHLKTYLDTTKSPLIYYGVEMVEEFLTESKKKFPQIASQILSTEQFNSSKESFDYIVCSGTFNIRYHENTSENDLIFKDMIKNLFERTRKCLSLNLMSDQVDFQQTGSWHVNPGDFLNYVSRNLSRRVSIDSSYMPYEYTVTIFKDDSIIRPENVFKI